MKEGQRFGLLSLVERGPGKKRADGVMRKTWICACTCGQRKEVRQDALLSGQTKSCGCNAIEAHVKDLTGRRLGKLIVVGRSSVRPESQRDMSWVVQCDCGQRKVMSTGNVKRARSCGCTRKHGHSTRTKGNPTYKTWAGMLSRCRNPNASSYSYYGGRGISVCERWAQYEAFLGDMGEKLPGMSLDRINPNGNYEPGNCRWVPAADQQRNKRLSHDRVVQILESFRHRDEGLIAEIQAALIGEG
jgi:hypothetical protein